MLEWNKFSSSHSLGQCVVVASPPDGEIGTAAGAAPVSGKRLQ